MSRVIGKDGKFLSIVDELDEFDELIEVSFSDIGLMLPRAYNGCNCLCHSESGVMHVMPCCSPDKPPMPDFKIKYDDPNMARILERKKKTAKEDKDKPMCMKRFGCKQ